MEKLLILELKFTKMIEKSISFMMYNVIISMINNTIYKNSEIFKILDPRLSIIRFIPYDNTTVLLCTNESMMLINIKNGQFTMEFNATDILYATNDTCFYKDKKLYYGKNCLLTTSINVTDIHRRNMISSNKDYVYLIKNDQIHYYNILTGQFIVNKSDINYIGIHITHAGNVISVSDKGMIYCNSDELLEIFHDYKLDIRISSYSDMLFIGVPYANNEKGIVYMFIYYEKKYRLKKICKNNGYYTYISLPNTKHFGSDIIIQDKTFTIRDDCNSYLYSIL